MRIDIGLVCIHRKRDDGLKWWSSDGASSSVALQLWRYNSRGSDVRCALVYTRTGGIYIYQRTIDVLLCIYTSRTLLLQRATVLPLHRMEKKIKWSILDRLIIIIPHHLLCYFVWLYFFYFQPSAQIFNIFPNKSRENSIGS